MQRMPEGRRLVRDWPVAQDHGAILTRCLARLQAYLPASAGCKKETAKAWPWRFPIRQVWLRDAYSDTTQ
ncbi:MAG: hypothetical protein KIS92_22920, partial [Planctomycetota bacterium]|nr:hypothetical protein [Planctomycetota bacterium]